MVRQQISNAELFYHVVGTYNIIAWIKNKYLLREQSRKSESDEVQKMILCFSVYYTRIWFNWIKG